MYEGGNVMMRLKKIFVSTLAIGLLSAAVVCSAETSATFKKAYVDSNEFKRVEGADASKADTSEYASVSITDIFDADGKECEYKAVYAKVRSNGYNATTSEDGNTYRTAYRNQTTSIKLKQEYRAKGTELHLWAMGRNPSLDCMISGVFYGN